MCPSSADTYTVCPSGLSTWSLLIGGTPPRSVSSRSPPASAAIRKSPPSLFTTSHLPSLLQLGASNSTVDDEWTSRLSPVSASMTKSSARWPGLSVRGMGPAPDSCPEGPWGYSLSLRPQPDPAAGTPVRLTAGRALICSAGLSRGRVRRRPRWVRGRRLGSGRTGAVSYTHLTLPTNREV